MSDNIKKYFLKHFLSTFQEKIHHVRLPKEIFIFKFSFYILITNPETYINE